MNRRGFGSGGADRDDDPSREVGVADDAGRSGFGSRRWSDLPLGSREDVGGAGAPSPFGSPSWQQYDADADEADSEAGPRRRKPPAPPPHPRKTVAALGATVRLTRDDAGLPHIAARNERDAYAALGYCMAEDRLWQMDLVRRLATGRVAELLGPAFAGHDALVRTTGVARRATAGARQLPGGAREVLAAFTAGVNAVRAEVRPAECEALGYEIEPWTIADSLAIEVLLGFAASLRVWPTKLLAARAIASSGLDRARWICDTPIELAQASSDRTAVWRQLDLGVIEVIAGLPLDPLVDGSAVAVTGPGGAAIVAGALHLAPSLPPLAYVARLQAPGLALAGASLLGTPIFALGRNAKCAWAASTALLDDADCVVEELDGIGNFRTETGWAKLHVRREQVRIRDGEPLQLDVVETRNGPLVSHLRQRMAGATPDAREPALALRWGPNSTGCGVAGWLALARARDLRDVASAAALLDRGPWPVALVAGDATGAVGTFRAGGMPVRTGPSAVPVRGFAGEAMWKGVQGVASSRRSAAGPAAVAAAGCIGDDPGDAAEVARRLRDLAAAAAPSADALRAALGDCADVLARAVAPASAAALAAQEASSVAGDDAPARVAEILRAWDGSFADPGPAPAIFAAAVLHVLPQELFAESRFGPLVRIPDVAWRATARILAAESSPWFPDPSGRDRALGSALGRAVDWLRTALGPDPKAWTLAGVVECARRHPLAEREAFAGGAPAAARETGGPFAAHRLGLRAGSLPLATRLAPAARLVADLATDEAHVAIAGGASGRVGHAHFADLLDAFFAGQDRILALTGEAKGDVSELVAG